MLNRLQKLCYKALQDIKADGFVNTEIECGCVLADFVPCGDGPYEGCEPALEVTIPNDPDLPLRHPQTNKVVMCEGDPGEYIMVPMSYEGEV